MSVYKIAILICMVSVLLFGCSDSKPVNVGKDLYSESVKITKMLDVRIESGSQFTEQEIVQIDSFVSTYLYNNSSLNKDEQSLVNNIFDIENYYKIYKTTADYDQKMNAIKMVKEQLKNVKKFLNVK